MNHIKTYALKKLFSISQIIELSISFIFVSIPQIEFGAYPSKALQISKKSIVPFSNPKCSSSCP